MVNLFRLLICKHFINILSLPTDKINSQNNKELVMRDCENAQLSPALYKTSAFILGLNLILITSASIYLFILLFFFNMVNNDLSKDEWSHDLEMILKTVNQK